MKKKSGFAPISNGRLYYETAGKGNSLLLVHGNGGDCSMWEDQFEEFAQNYNIIIYDMRGFGKSSMPIEGKAYSHHNDLKELLSFLGVSEAHILGLSMGSRVAIDFILTYPKMSSSLIAAGPWFGGYASPSVEELALVFGPTPSIIKEKGIQAAMEHWWNDPYLKPTMSILELAERLWKSTYSFWHFMHQDPIQNLNPPAIEQTNKIKLPTLIITAEKDLKACIEIADLLERIIPNSKKVVIDDAGHIMNMEKPKIFNEIVLQFLEML
jgi:pimeloyl-ACP methyl ester carboxylesterase